MISSEQPPDKVYSAKARISDGSCGCPGSKPGIFSADPQAHLQDCPIRKKLATGRFTTDVWVLQDECFDHSLGVSKD